MARKIAASKIAASAFDPKVQKQPRQQEQPSSILGKNPSWRVQRIDFDAPFSWKHMTQENLPQVLSRLQAFEKMTWGEIEKQKSSHSTDASRVCKEAREHLEKLGLGDTEHLYQLQVGGAARIWGIRIETTFALLWWDPDHSVYPVEKKHT